MSAEWPWSVLDLAGPTDLRSVKRAYAKTLKRIDRNDPVVFQELRDAFETAKNWAQDPAAHAAPVVPVPPVAIVKPSMHDIVQSDLAPQTTQAAPQDTVSFAPLPAELPGLQVPVSEDNAADFDPDPASQVLSLLTENHDQFLLAHEALDQLEALLDNRKEHSLTIQAQIEQAFFEGLSQRMEEHFHALPRALADLAETYFGWLTDGIRYNRNFGWHSMAGLIIYEASRAATPDPNAVRHTMPPAQSPSIWMQYWIPLNTFLVVMFGTVIRFGGNLLSTDVYFEGAITALILLYICYFALQIIQGFLALLVDTTHTRSFFQRLWIKMCRRHKLFAQLDMFRCRHRGQEDLTIILSGAASLYIALFWLEFDL